MAQPDLTTADPSASRTVPPTAPPACPGTESEAAGQSSACAGCPNQAACSDSSTARANGEAPPVDPDIARIEQRIGKNIKHKILVLSGKGGVGKSTLAAQLAFSLSSPLTAPAPGTSSADLDDDLSLPDVGLLDVDICGPSAPTMLGLEGQTVTQSGAGWQPVYVKENLGVMSVAFMLPSREDAVIWRGPRKTGLIKQFLKDVDWGDMDFLVIDSPPGTSDEHISLVQFLKTCNIDGAVIVTTPQEVSLVDVRKEINFCKKSGTPILGVVENMSGFVCPSCSTCTPIFAPSSGGAEKMCLEMGVPFLGRVPLDPALAQAGETGVFLREMEAARGGATVMALAAVVGKIKEAVGWKDKE
mmetsp:Transcript_22909/g.60817  ORF Transcript_22909/g.60817 Transcript_22909/m.60817 type:complete len:358 (+) Transcript_22909:57-1130(+)